jgi:hypothetical protein
MSLIAHLQQHRPKPRRCFHHNRDHNIPDQVRHHAIGAVNELGVSGKEDSSGSRAHITTSENTDREFPSCRPATSVETPSLQSVLSATSAITVASKPQSNTLASRIRTRTLFTIAIAGNTNIAFLMIHAVGGVNLRIRAASVVDCGLVAVVITRTVDDTGGR